MRSIARLAALLMTHRKFNRLDGLLSRLKAPPARLKTALHGQADSAAPPSSRLLEDAAQWARQDATRREPVVDVEHWLKALCESRPEVGSSKIK